MKQLQILLKNDNISVDILYKYLLAHVGFLYQKQYFFALEYKITKKLKFLQFYAFRKTLYTEIVKLEQT